MRYFIDAARNSFTNQPYLVHLNKQYSFRFECQESSHLVLKAIYLFNDKMKIQIYCRFNMRQTLRKFLPHYEQQGSI